MDLRRFQAELSRHLAGVEHPRALAALALAEEAGEVARCVLDAEAYGKAGTAALAGEVGDTLVALAEVATRYGLDLADVATAALGKIATKAPGWRAELGDRLVALRRRMDGA